MQKTLVAASFAALLGMGGTVLAADVYSSGGSLKDAPVYVPVTTWTGFYVGANGGYAWGATDGKLDASSGVGCYEYCYGYGDGQRSLSPSGGFGGGQIGYNLQRDRFVFGIEADLQGAGIEDSARVDMLGGDASAAAKSELNWFGTVRGRVGYTLDQTLVYFTGGLAFGGVKDTLSVMSPLGDMTKVSKDDTKTGFVLGGGLEHKLNPAWSIKAEYQYIDLGSTKLSADAGDYCAWATASLKEDHAYHTIRVGLNYHIHDEYVPLK
jgi:outer membrane immunogenic protein